MKKKLLLAVTSLITIAVFACRSLTVRTPLKPVSATETITEPTQPQAATQTPIATDTATASLPTEAPAATSSGVSFKNDVMPIFQNSCNKCHGIETTKKGLDLTTYENLMMGSFNGPVIEAGDADNSYLVQQIVDGEIPKRGDPLSDKDIQTIIDWVNAGALNN